MKGTGKEYLSQRLQKAGHPSVKVFLINHAALWAINRCVFDPAFSWVDLKAMILLSSHFSSGGTLPPEENSRLHLKPSLAALLPDFEVFLSSSSGLV